MKKKRTTAGLIRFFRRVTAFFLAIMGIWVLSLTGSPDRLFDKTGTDSGVQTSAAAANPAAEDTGGGKVTFWQRFLLGETPLFLSWKKTAASGDKIDSPGAQQGQEAGEAEAETKLEAVSPGNIVAKDMVPTNTKGYDTAGDVYIYNSTSKKLDVAAMAAATVNISLKKGDKQPQVLIMHTHGTEAYAMDGKDVYKESDPARTTDTNYNIIRVGDEVTRIFTEMGLQVIHDRNFYDYPAYDGCYERSRAAVEKYLAEYPSIKIVLDIHRDALVGADGTIYKAVTEIDGVKTAQVLLLVGSDDSGLSYPKWKENLTLAVKIQERMNSLWPDLARPISLRSNRFNQQLTTGSILVEVGTHGNTLQEALAGARLFARAAGQVLLDLEAS